jgi:hypothetical protein
MDADGNIVSTQAYGGSYLGNTFFDDPGGTRILNFSAAGALESSSVDYSDGPHGVIATQDGQSNVLSIMQVLENMGLAQIIDLNANQGNNGGNSSSTWDAINNGIGAFGIGNGVKGSMIDYAVTASGSEATSALVTYGKVTDALGVAGGLVAMGTSGYNMYNEYEQNHRISDIHVGDADDFAVGTASVIATVALTSNPIGWAIGAGAALYFTGRFIYQYEQTH